jgi:ketose-bisphosphate aldolase
MIAMFSEVLAGPGEGRAVGAFTAYDLETACGVLGAAESRRVPAILLLSRAAFQAPRGQLLFEAIGAASRSAAVPVCIQLDHVSDLALIERAAQIGCGAVMADGSRLELEENAELVAEAVRRVDNSVAVEGELGHLAGGEDIARAVSAGGLTDPAQVGEFVERSGLSCLAVSIGNVHGTYAQPPRLDWERLTQIRQATAVPLSLHGASGLSDADIIRAIELGISKVNVNLELRQAYIRATAEFIDSESEGFDMLQLHDRQVRAIEAIAGAKLDTFSGAA